MPDITAGRPIAGAPIETAWGDQVHDAIEGLQAGFVDIAISGAASATALVTFPRAYSAPPIVVVAGNSVTAGVVAKLSSTTPPTATAFTAVAQHVAGTSGTWTVRVYWMALGTPA